MSGSNLSKRGLRAIDPAFNSQYSSKSLKVLSTSILLVSIELRSAFSQRSFRTSYFEASELGGRANSISRDLYQ